jgi:hypothetical protein
MAYGLHSDRADPLSSFHGADTRDYFTVLAR